MTNEEFQAAVCAMNEAAKNRQLEWLRRDGQWELTTGILVTPGRYRINPPPREPIVRYGVVRQLDESISDGWFHDRDKAELHVLRFGGRIVELREVFP